ncbi:MAG TPA: AAA family ATPase [Gemmataceae bacterium]|nr:AAA family ATPase [Gemmataceae bacterium]
MSFYFPDAHEIRTRARALPGGDWLWAGYLLPKHTTLLTSFWKSGKTTLVSVLLSKLAAGGTFAGQAVKPGRAVVVTEESEHLWADRIDRLSLDTNVRILCRPFREQPKPEEWEGLIDSLVALREQKGLDLLVIDPLVHFLPGRSENDSIAIVTMLRAARRLADTGVSVLILHHPRKEASAPGRAARGSGALSGEVDIILEMDELGRGTEEDRRRRLWAFSRFKESPRRQVIELNATGTDYASLGDFATNEFDDGWPVLFGVLEDAEQKLTRRQVCDQWPEDFVKPDNVTIWRWLDRAVAEGRVLQAGTGRKNDPFQYWLRSSEERWANDPNRLENFLDPLPELPSMRDLMGLGPRPGKKGGRS